MYRAWAGEVRAGTTQPPPRRQRPLNLMSFVMTSITDRPTTTACTAIYPIYASLSPYFRLNHTFI